MRVLALAAALVPSALIAQGDSVRQAGGPPGPPIRRIATASALSKDPLGSVTAVREVGGGRVLVNDGARRRLLLMDSTLKTISVVLDSLSETANFYGARPGTLLPYRSDSSLFVDPASYALLLLDGNGNIARVRSVPRVEDVFYFSGMNPTYGWPGVDAKGRIVYRMPARPAPPKVAPPAGVPWIPPDPDSAFIVGIDLETRKLDTLGVIRTPKQDYQVRLMESGGFSISVATNPLPSTDDWAVLPSGELAFVRGRDYRVEYLHADGQLTSSEKLPFEWQRLADEDKQKLVDSVKTAQRRTMMQSYVSALIRWVNMYNRQYPPGFKVEEGFVLQQGLQKEWKLPEGVKFPANYIYACAPGVEPTMTPPVGGAPVAAVASGPPGAPAGTPSCIPSPIMIGGGMTPPAPTLRDVSVLPASDLPDYRPPIGAGATRADADGNLWIRTIPAKPIPGGFVYDIVNPSGALVDRLQTPPGYTIVGFGVGKVVYLQMRDAMGIHLARVRLK
ncbi:MAG TPA: hypothetical protein VH559_07905 [Gemmatimonadaceae bacterium]